MLRVENLDVFYGDLQALDGVSLEVEEGAIVAIVGANGAGKTTLIRALAGMQRQVRGRVIFRDADISGWPSHRVCDLGLGQVAEGRQVFPYMSVLENLEMGAYTKAGRAQWLHSLERIHTLFPILAERASQLAGTLSGGEQQMLAIGRGLASAPKLLMLDEPSMGLAPAVADTIFERVSQIHREDHVTILLVEQRVAEALELSDHGYVLETGHMVLDGTHQTLLADDRVRRSYLGLTDA